MKNIAKNKGLSLLGLIFSAIVVIFILSFFNISIKDVFESPTGRENVEYIEGKTRNLWEIYMAPTVEYIFRDNWNNLSWKKFTASFDRLRADFDKAVNKLKTKQD